MILLVALAGSFIAVAVYFVRLGSINMDEGWGLYAARLVYEGKVPYRDFAFFQGPLLPYAYGIPQKVFGPGLEVARWTSFCLSLLTVGLGTRLSFERGGRAAAVIFLSTTTLTPLVLWSFTTTRTEPLSALLLMTAAFLILRGRARLACCAGAIAAGVLAMAARASSLPAAVFILAWAIQRSRRSARNLLLLILPGALIAGLALVPVALAPSAAWFDIVTAQAERHNQFFTFPAWTFFDYTTNGSRAVTDLHSIFGFVPMLGIAMAGLGCAQLVRSWTRKVAAPFPTAAIGLTGLAFMAYVPNIVPHSVYPVYFVPAFPLLLVVIATTLANHLRHPIPETRYLVGGAIGGLMLVQVMIFTANIRIYAPIEPDLAELRSAAKYLSAAVPEGGTVATLDTYLAVESGLKVPDGWEMSGVSYFPRLTEAEGRQLHLLTPQQLVADLRDQSIRAVAFSHQMLLLVKPDTPAGVLSDDELHRLLPGLDRFRLRKVFPRFGQFRDALYILLPAG